MVSMLLAMFALPLGALAQSSPAAHQQFLFAYKLLQRGDDRLAADAFDDYLGEFPDDEKVGDATYYRALLDRRAGRNQQAAERLSDVRPPQLVPAYAVDLLRGQVLVDLGRYPQAVEALERIDVGALKPDVRVSVLYLRGLARRGAAQLSGAAEDLKAAAEMESPMRGRALLDLARVQVQMDRLDEAIETLKRAMEVSDDAAVAEAARLAGDVSYNRGTYDAAVEFYGQVMSNHASSRHFGPSVIGTLWAHYSAERYPSVIDVFKRYRTALQVQDRVPAWYLAGSARQELGEHEQAVELFEQVAHGDGRYPLQEKVLYKLAASQFELGRYEAMSQTVARLRQQFPDSEIQTDAAFLLAAADAKQGDVARGVARLTQIIEEGPQSPWYLQGLLRRARLYETHGQLESAVRDYLTWLEASTFERVGQAADGRPVSQPTARQAGALVQLLKVHHRLGDHERAAALAAQWLETMRLSPLVEQEVMFRRSLALIQLDRSDDALAMFDRLERKHPINPFSEEAAYYRGLLLLSRDEVAQATPLLSSAASQEKLARPLRINALRLLALNQRGRGEDAAAAASLRDLESLASRDQLTDEELLWMARHLLEQGEAKAALGYAQPLVEGRPRAAASVRSEAIYLTGRAQRQLGQLDQAAKSFEQVVALGRGFDLEARLGLAKVSFDRGRHQQAMAELGGLINSESTPVAAEALFTGARIQRSMARQHRRSDNVELAVEANHEAQRLLKRLVLLYAFPQIEPLPQLAYLELAEIAAELDDSAGIEQELRELIDKYPDGPYATYAKAVLAADRGQVGDALALLETLRRSATEASLDSRLRDRVDRLHRLLEAG